MALQAHIKPIVYGIFNVGVGCGIVFANKAVLSVFNFKFVYCLTLIHTIVTMVGMWIFAAGGIFEIKRFTALQVYFPAFATNVCTDIHACRVSYGLSHPLPSTFRVMC